MIISDVAAELEEMNISSLALARACRFIWKSATKENPWLPPSGAIVAEAIESQENLEKCVKRLLKISETSLSLPPAKEQKTDEDTPIMWDDLDEEQRQKIRDKIINWSLKARESYLRSYGAPDDEIENQKGKS